MCAIAVEYVLGFISPFHSLSIRNLYVMYIYICVYMLVSLAFEIPRMYDYRCIASTAERMDVVCFTFHSVWFSFLMFITSYYILKTSNRLYLNSSIYFVRSFILPCVWRTSLLFFFFSSPSLVSNVCYCLISSLLKLTTVIAKRYDD